MTKRYFCGCGRWIACSGMLLLGLFASAPSSANSLPRFPAGAVWNQDISSSPVASAPGVPSATMISTLTGLGGWGGGNRLQIDFSIVVLHATAADPMRAITIHQGYQDYYYTDCEDPGTTMPLPAVGNTEGSLTDDYRCDNYCDDDDPNNPTCADCHLLVQKDNILYEAYSANLLPNNQIEALCLAKWDLGYTYPPQGRGDHCTSADAAGFPIGALLFSADDVYAAMQQPNAVDRHLGHAIRFILPNPRMANDPSLGGQNGKLYVRPGTHAGAPSGPVNTIPYGARLRLRSDFPFAGYNAAAQVLLRTMQKYGMVLADGGNIALTAEDDRYNTHKWSDPDINLGARVFDQTPGALKVNVSDFAVLDTGARIAETYDCVRTTVPTGLLFADGFE